jgi:hypothetical protein
MDLAFTATTMAEKSFFRYLDAFFIFSKRSRNKWIKCSPNIISWLMKKELASLLLIPVY